MSVATKLELNPIAVTRRIKAWLEENFQDVALELEFDENSLDTDKLHFFAYIETDTGVRLSPTPTQYAYAALKQDLGPAFWCVQTPKQLDIYATQPTATDAAGLRAKFQRHSQQLMRSVWPWPIALAFVLLSFLSMCYFSQKLHTHWHQWTSPWETLFHWLFNVTIYVGDRVFGDVTFWPLSDIVSGTLGDSVDALG